MFVMLHCEMLMEDRVKIFTGSKVLFEVLNIE